MRDLQVYYSIRISSDANGCFIFILFFDLMDNHREIIRLTSSISSKNCQSTYCLLLTGI